MRVSRRLFLSWLVLCTLTVAYIGIDHSAENNGIRTASVAVTVAAILIAAIKVRIIFREFMEVRHAPTLLRRLTDLWVGGIVVVLIASYLAGSWLTQT